LPTHRQQEVRIRSRRALARASRPIVVRRFPDVDLVDQVVHELAAPFCWLWPRKLFEPVFSEPRLNLLPGGNVILGAVAVHAVAEPDVEAVIPEARNLEIDLSVVKLLEDGAQGAASCRDQLKTSKQNACKKEQEGHKHCLKAMSCYDRNSSVCVSHEER